MVAIITTSTIATSTASSTLIVISVLFLLILLVQKELTSALNSRTASKLHKILNIGILPLLFVFLLFVIARISQEISK